MGTGHCGWLQLLAQGAASLYIWSINTNLTDVPVTINTPICSGSIPLLRNAPHIFWTKISYCKWPLGRCFELSHKQVYHASFHFNKLKCHLLDPFCWDSYDHVMLHPIDMFPRGDPPFVWPIPVRASPCRTKSTVAWDQSFFWCFPYGSKHCLIRYLPSGKHIKNYGKSQCLMGKLAINSNFQ